VRPSWAQSWRCKSSHELTTTSEASRKAVRATGGPEEAENGQQAVALARELLPDVILMDVKMPVMDRIEAIRRILAEIPGMNILALSIYSDDGFNSDMMRDGALGYIMKGGDFTELFCPILPDVSERALLRPRITNFPCAIFNPPMPFLPSDPSARVSLY
jgi:DNA-binding NarL/FixJ family response regulator